LRDNSDPNQKIEHLTIRLYGALILAQVRVSRLGTSASLPRRRTASLLALASTERS
jgi:hypothetical protein